MPATTTTAAPTIMRRRRSLEKPFMPGASFAALVELLQQPFRLVEILARVDVLRIDLEHRLPLGNGLGELLLAIVADAAIVVLIDETRPRLSHEGRGVLVVGSDPGELVEGGVGITVLPLIELLLALAVEHLLLEGDRVGIARGRGEELVDVAQRLTVVQAVGRLARLGEERIDLGRLFSRLRRRGSGRRGRGGSA